MRKWIISALAIGAALLTATAVLLVSALQRPEAPVNEEAQFVLMDCGGRVGVCEVGRETDEPRLTGIRVEFLPLVDRQSLREGIRVRDLTELAMLLEDLGC